MGGSGSGRWGSRRPKAESLQRIDLTVVSRGRTLSPNDVLDVSYALNDGTLAKVRLCLSATPTAFGGRRLWLLCPSCGDRCRVIYVGRRWFACRVCHRLRYSSQAESPAGRAIRAMFKIVKRLDPTATCTDLPPKPIGMHWRTYDRLTSRYIDHDNRWAAATLRRFGFRL
jgi:hypothetical protein